MPETFSPEQKEQFKAELKSIAAEVGATRLEIAQAVLAIHGNKAAVPLQPKFASLFTFVREKLHGQGIPIVWFCPWIERKKRGSA